MSKGYVIFEQTHIVWVTLEAMHQNKEMVSLVIALLSLPSIDLLTQFEFLVLS